MFKSRARAISMVSALGVALLISVRAAEDPTKATGTIIGSVVDLQGHPVAGAKVWAGDRDRVEAQTRTEADGRFRLGPVSVKQAATVWAEAEEEGLAREHFDEVRVFAGHKNDLGAIALAPGVRFAGRFVDAKGQPVARVTASILSRHHELGYTVTLNGPKWTRRGDDQGRFRTPALPVGQAELTIKAAGKALRHLDSLVEPGRAIVDLGDLRLDDERPVTGVVVDQDSRPIAGASVVVDADYDHPAITDAQGRFAVHDASLTATWFRVEAPGYFDPALQRYHEFKGQRTDLRINLQKAFTVEGSVIDADTGTPVPIERVQLCSVRRDDDNEVTLVG